MICGTLCTALNGFEQPRVKSYLMNTFMCSHVKTKCTIYKDMFVSVHASRRHAMCQVVHIIEGFEQPLVKSLTSQCSKGLIEQTALGSQTDTSYIRGPRLSICFQQHSSVTFGLLPSSKLRCSCFHYVSNWYNIIYLVVVDSCSSPKTERGQNIRETYPRQLKNEGAAVKPTFVSLCFSYY
jgi:hypothetical protein